jgi:hypothetical protein
MAELNPLTGLPLEAWQTLVTGPPETWNAFDQGPRRTVVDMRPGAVLPPWIVRLDIPVGAGGYVTSFIDNGQPGGSYSPSVQQLPELSVTAPAPTGGVSWGAFLLLALGVLAIAWSRRA